MQSSSQQSPKPVVVITDTTEFFNSYQLADTRWVLLAKEIHAGRVRWIVPEVVVRETVRHQARAWESVKSESIPAVKKAGRALRHFGIKLTVGSDSIDKAIESAAEDAKIYERTLRARIVELGGEIANLPTIEHEKLLAWDMLGRKPFAATGKGYRDALIWATLLEYLATAPPNDQVIFVSNNTDDFIDQNGIHADLLGDTKGVEPSIQILHSPGLTVALSVVKDLRGVAPDGVQVPEQTASKVEKGGGSGQVRQEDAVESQLADSTALESKKQSVKLRDHLITALEEQCSDLTNTELGGEDKDGDVYGPDWLPVDLENPTVHYLVPDLDSISWDTVETFSDGTQLINVTATAELTVDGYMYKSAFYREEQSEWVYALDADHNAHYAWVAVLGFAKVAFSILLSPDYDAVNHTELISFETESSRS